MSESYEYIKKTIFNNNGLFGSDIVEYQLLKNNVMVGSMVHDLYMNRSVIKYKDDRYILNNSNSKIFSKTTERTIAHYEVFQFNLVGNNEVFIFSFDYNFPFSKSTFSKLYSGLTKIKIYLNYENTVSTNLYRDIPIKGKIESNNEINEFVILISFISIEQNILSLDLEKNS